MWFGGSSGNKGSETTTAPAALTPVAPTTLQATPRSPSGSVPATGVDPTSYFAKYGYPIPIHDIQARQEFVSCYNRALRNPTWVIEHLTAQSRNIVNGDRSKSHFAEDTNIPVQFRARLADYFRSGYDRGHQAPAADAKFSQTAMDETFYLTNMSPQVGEGFNRDYWAHFERFARNLTNSYSSVRVITGPLYLPKKDPATNKWIVKYEMIGNPPSIAVPTHFFKILIGENPIKPSLPAKGVAVGAFVLPNEPIDNKIPLRVFAVPLEAIERSVGVEFMPKLPVSQRRELCKEITCEIEVREFNDTVNKLLPAPKK